MTGLISSPRKQGNEYDHNFLWRWSPWLQIYVAAAAFRLGGLTTYAGRLPFALLGLACIFLVYQLVRHNFGDRAWALMAAALLTCSVPFLLYARQCRYYSLGAFLTLISLYAFREDWQSRFWPALLLCLSMGLLFYTNYLLFFSFIMPALLAGIWLYPREIPLKRTTIIILATLIIIVPGLFLFQYSATIPNNKSDCYSFKFGELLYRSFPIYDPSSHSFIPAVEMAPGSLDPLRHPGRTRGKIRLVPEPDYCRQHPNLVSGPPM